MRPSPRLRDVLESWCAAGVSGALRVLDPPGGAVYLLDGGVEYAECAVAAGIERLLTASGRLPAEAWRTAVNVGRVHNRVGAQLLQTGLLTAAELESVALLALYDAAHFLFDLDATTRFEPGVRHHLGHGQVLELKLVCQEVDRRKLLLADAWPDAAIDTSAVVPQRRLRDQCVALSALQWEVVASSDRRRTPVDLARLLGRDTFTVMLEVRRMVRAGLVEPGRPGGSAATGSVAMVRANTERVVTERVITERWNVKPPETARFQLHKREPEQAEPVPPIEKSEPAAIPLPRRPVSTLDHARSLPSRDPAFTDDILTRLIAGLGSW